MASPSSVVYACRPEGIYVYYKDLMHGCVCIVGEKEVANLRIYRDFFPNMPTQGRISWVGVIQRLRCIYIGTFMYIRSQKHICNTYRHVFTLRAG